VGSASQPLITGIQLSGADVILAGTNGTQGASCLVLSSGDIFLPLASWPAIATNQFGPGGGFIWTNVWGGTNFQCFYLLKLP
jgi:hypothetical protein